ncbi:MAG: hypothetical protein HFJ53_07115 [Clostridia bacterium]|nr:hypothetical protein [Clostridia bacterium]
MCYECKHKIGVKNGRNSHRYMNRKNSKLGLCTSYAFNYDSLEKNFAIHKRAVFEYR